MSFSSYLACFEYFSSDFKKQTSITMRPFSHKFLIKWYPSRIFIYSTILQNNIVSIEIILVRRVCEKIDANHLVEVYGSTLFLCVRVYTLNPNIMRQGVRHTIYNHVYMCYPLFTINNVIVLQTLHAIGQGATQPCCSMTSHEDRLNFQDTLILMSCLKS